MNAYLQQPATADEITRVACVTVVPRLKATKVVVKIDFTNAFNGIHRNEMLSSVHSRIPELYA